MPLHADMPPFSCDFPDAPVWPLLISVPHAGRAYDADLLAMLRAPVEDILRLEDRHADVLGRRVAQALGCSLITAHAPRAVIDLNRDPADFDSAMISGMRRGVAHRPGPKSRAGLGLVPRMLPQTGELWRTRLPWNVLEARVRHIHAPWHQAIADELARLHGYFGAAILIDLHSMPSLEGRGGQEAARIVIGDRFGRSASADLVHHLHDALSRDTGGQAWPVTRNAPYAGGYTLDRHAHSESGAHAIQIEIDRALYLDSGWRELGDGADALIAHLARALHGLAQIVMDEGRGPLLQAAE